MKRTALWLGILVAGAAGCHRPAATPPRAASAAPTSPPVEQDKSTEPAQPALDASPPPSKEMTPAGRVLLFSPIGPLLLELVVTIDGQSLPELRRKAVSQLVERLTQQEGGGLPWESALEDPRFALVPPPRGRPERKALLAAIDLNHDGQVQADEAVEFYARQDQLGPPLRFAATASAWSERGSSPLWQLVDQNGDGQIEAAEIAALADLLAARDADGDELITENELAGGQLPESQESMQDQSSGRGSSRLAVLCDATFRGEAVAYLLEELYPSGERSAAELSTVDRLVAAVDRNGNGRIDGRESLALPQAEPVGRIRVAFGPGVSPADQVVVEWFDPQLSVAAPSQRTPAGITCELAGNRLVIERDEQTAVAPGAEANPLAAQFASLDGDANGYLESSELPAATPELERLFRAADLNSDGKLFRTELDELVAWQRDLQRARARLDVSAADDPLFGALDGSGDGRLSPRELSQTTRALARFDSNGDGRIEMGELPVEVRLAFSHLSPRMTPGAPPPAEAPEGVAPDGSAAPVTPDDQPPEWFRRMDLNGDGDLSPREFLGTRAQFDALDADRDGFLTSAESRPAAP